VRVLAVVHYPVFGGPHNQILQLAQPLRSRGVETIAVLPHDARQATERFGDAGVDVHQLRLHRLRATANPLPHIALIGGLPVEVARLSRLIRDLQIDVVQIGGMVNPHAAFAARATGRPVVWQLVDVGTPRVVATAAMLFVRALATVVMSSGRTVADRAPFGGGIRRLVTYLPPVDVERFQPRPDGRAAMRAALGIPDDAPVIGCVANINPEKGITDLVEAFVAARADAPDLHLVLIGAEHGTHQAYAAKIRERLASAGAADVVRFMGERSDIPDLLRALDVFTLASHSEGTPTVVMEAMASGLPVVVTRVGGTWEIVDDGIDGLLVSSHDPPALATAIRSLIRDPVAAATLGRAARERAVREFTLERSADSHLRAYELALESRTSDRGVRRSAGS
jgi:glycosyltransferase involved in cell wall biosynthesis